MIKDIDTMMYEAEMYERKLVGFTTCQQYATSRSVSVPTVTLHARKLGIAKVAGRYLFTDEQCTVLDASIVGKVGRPFKK